MNFKNLQKFLKKNYKKIIIVCLIMLLLSNKMYENFTTTQALDAVKLTEKKVNGMFYEVDGNWNKSSKGIYGKKTIEAEGNIISRKGNISATVGNVGAKVDITAGRNMTATGNVTAKGNVYGKNLCIGKTCLNENHLKMIAHGFKLRVEDGGKEDGPNSTKNKNQYIHNHGGTRLGPHSRYPVKLKMYNW